jgi:ribonuclease P/MRP protein subunit POP3
MRQIAQRHEHQYNEKTFSKASLKIHSESNGCFDILQLTTRLTSQARPSIPSNTQNLFLATLLTTVQSAVTGGSRKSFKASARKALPRSEIADSVEGTSASPDSMVYSETSGCAAGSTALPSPVFSQLALSSGHMTIGINEVTRRLELQLKSVRHSVTLTTTPHTSPILPNIPPIAAVFVCRADVNPPILLDHIPHLVAGCNSIRPGSNTQGARQPLKLVVLPKGSESALAQALGLRRAAVIAVHVSISDVSILTSDALDRMMPRIYQFFVICSNLCL